MNTVTFLFCFLNLYGALVIVSSTNLYLEPRTLSRYKWALLSEVGHCDLVFRVGRTFHLHLRKAPSCTNATSYLKRKTFLREVERPQT